MAETGLDTIAIDRCKTCDRAFWSVGAIKHWQAHATDDYVAVCCECTHPDGACWYEADSEPERGFGRTSWKILASIALILVAAAFWLFGIAVVLAVVIGLPFLIGVAVGGSQEK